MTTRRVQLIGYSLGCDIIVEWNGQIVFDGTVLPNGNKDSAVSLLEWTTDTGVLGSIPFKITCKSGTISFVNIYMNHFMPLIEILSLGDDPAPPGYTLWYSASTRSRYARKIVESSETHMTQPWLQQAPDSVSDGKDNVLINGEPEFRFDTHIHNGPWHWHLAAGEVLTCNIKVDPPPNLA